MALVPESLDVLAEQAVQRLFARRVDPASLAHRAHELDDIGVQAVEPRFRLILLDGITRLSRDGVEVAFVDLGSQGIDLSNAGRGSQAFNDVPALRRERAFVLELSCAS